MENKYTSFVNDDDEQVLAAISSIYDIQLFKDKKIFKVAIKLGEYLVEHQDFDTLTDAEHRFNRLMSLGNFRLIGTKNAPENMVKIAIVIEKFPHIVLSKNDNREQEFFGKWFIRYIAGRNPLPFARDHIMAEMFESEEEARATFNAIKKQLCFNGLDVIENPGE